MVRAMSAATSVIFIADPPFELNTLYRDRAWIGRASTLSCPSNGLPLSRERPSRPFDLRPDRPAARRRRRASRPPMILDVRRAFGWRTHTELDRGKAVPLVKGARHGVLLMGMKF